MRAARIKRVMMVTKRRITSRKREGKRNRLKETRAMRKRKGQGKVWQ